MKLSKKGRQKILIKFSELAHLEFEQSDFDGCVVLNQSEAQQLLSLAGWAKDFLEGTAYYTDEDEAFLSNMRKRIEQAEESE